MRRVRALFGSVVVAGAVLVGTASPAAAHSASEAVQYGCGSGYGIVSDGTRAVRTDSGAVWGYVHLAYNSGNGRNCVVTRKTSYHGTPSRVRAEITVAGDGAYSNADNSASHWESVKRYASDTCVQYFGWIWDPAGSTLAAGGRTTWGNCG
ncbi:hypothetical protein [Saccharomonospora halophila]|uniref:hypothetical protein n=1 Tax=Saccharomonospora halophila TaxID=129922 RepID=UPI00037409A7|nr:hypothetical protein [Saccharomonospora halophila]